MSLYDVVHAPQPRKRDRKLHILIAIGLILVLAGLSPFRGPCIYSGSIAIL